MDWKPIEKMVEPAIWVIKYDMHHLPDTGNFCQPDTPGAVKTTDCHGWYENEADAMAVLRHFPKPNSYQIEKVWKRELI